MDVEGDDRADAAADAEAFGQALRGERLNGEYVEAEGEAVLVDRPPHPAADAEVEPKPVPAAAPVADEDLGVCRVPALGAGVSAQDAAESHEPADAHSPTVAGPPGDSHVDGGRRRDAVPVAAEVEAIVVAAAEFELGLVGTGLGEGEAPRDEDEEPREQATGW